MNLTIDNAFRNPLRWGKCPVNMGEYKVFGLQTKKYYLERKQGRFFSVTFYFYKWYYHIGNIKIRY